MLFKNVYLFNVFWSDGQGIDLVRHAQGSLHSGNVRVDKYRCDALLFQSLQRLRSRVVELPGLAN